MTVIPFRFLSLRIVLDGIYGVSYIVRDSSNSVISSYHHSSHEKATVNEVKDGLE